MSDAKPYDMTKQEDINRWFIEMTGYLVHFEEQGTDLEGRRYAKEAFKQLRQIMYKEN